MIHNKIIKKSIAKTLAILLIVALNWAGLSAVIETIAYFNDTEGSPQNVISAASLDFAVINNNIEKLIGIELGEDIEFISILVKMNGSLDIQYNTYAEKISGNNDFCNALQLEASHSSVFYNGALLSFNENNVANLGTWSFEIKMLPGAGNFSHGEQCNIDLVFKGWRDDVSDFNQSGFTDEERIHLHLTSRMIVLNEFLPRPDGVDYGFNFGNDDSTKPQGEWVEIYNNSDFAFDLSGWYVWDASGNPDNKIFITAQNTYPAGTVIGAKSWLVVYMNKAVLDNTGDMVKLFDSADTLIDSYSYISSDYCELKPTPGKENSFIVSGTNCGLVPSNKSYARIPDGIGGWVDPVPTPGGPNILKEGEPQFASEAEQAEPVLEPEPESEIQTITEMPEEDDLSDEMIIIDGLFVAAPLNSEPLPVEALQSEAEQGEPAVEEPVGEEPIGQEQEQEPESQFLPEAEQAEPEEELIEEEPIVEEAPTIEQAPADVPDNPADIGSDSGNGSEDSSGDGVGGENESVSIEASAAGDSDAGETAGTGETVSE